MTAAMGHWEDGGSIQLLFMAMIMAVHDAGNHAHATGCNSSISPPPRDTEPGEIVMPTRPVD